MERHEKYYNGIYFILNLILALILFSNIVFFKRVIDFKLGFIIIAYFSLIILNKVLNFYKFKCDESLSLIVNLFLLISLVILYRINPNVSFKQMIFVIVGYFLYFSIIYFIKDISKFYKFKNIYLLMTFLFMSLSFFFGKYINGSKNWVSFLGITFQPSEFGKIFLILYVSSVLRDNRNKKDKYMCAFLLACIITCLVLQKDLGTSLIVFIIVMIMYYMKTYKYKFLLFSCLSTFLAGIVTYFKFSHVRVRIKAWLRPESDPNGSSYQVLQGFFAMGSGGLFGKGLYRGNLELIPVNYTDYIFVSIVEEFGILSGIVIVVLYFLFFTRVFSKAMMCNKNFESVLLVLGFSILICFQTFLILGGTLNLIPLTGVTLPFVSYGGSSLISMFLMFGIIQKVLEGK